VEPMKYIGRISPRPLFILNGTGDSRIPTECARILHERAGEPKTVKWVDAGHLNVRSREFKTMVGRQLLKWLESEGIIDPDTRAVNEGASNKGQPPVFEQRLIAKRE